MLFKDRLERLGTVAKHLPFALDDYDAANQLFCRWIDARDDDDLKTLEVWLYCYTQRYVLVRLLRTPGLGGGEADRVIEEVFTRARAQFEKVADPTRFTHWVCVVCHNTLFNSLRRPYHRVDLDAEALPDDDTEEDPDLPEPDRALIRHAVTRALEALPEAIGRVARMHLLEGRSYHFIATQTGHPLPTVRTYAAKALARLRQDPGVRRLGQLFDRPPP